MLIVIDLSKKLIGYNLYESFFYKLKKEGTLAFANNPLTIDDQNINYEEIKTKVQNILYDNHASSYSICILYDMNTQSIDPINNSITSNIKKVKEKIIKPLLPEYYFDKLYYLSLDNIKRNYDGIPYDENINLAIEFDSLGYTKNIYSNEYSNIIFNTSEIDNLDNIWDELKHTNNHKELVSKFKEIINPLFTTKIDLIKEKYKELYWYQNTLNKVYKIVTNNFETILYKEKELLSNISKPSILIKNALKLEVSSYNENDTIIIHININDKYINKNKESLKYRHQIEIIGLIIYLATNDTRNIFESGQSISRENHWLIELNLNDLNLTRMLKSYNSKLKIELDKINKYQNNEIEYTEYIERNINLKNISEEVIIPKPPKIGLCFNKNDPERIKIYFNDLYSIYLKGIDYNNKRICNLTLQLRSQKENHLEEKKKKSSVLELSNELNKMKDNVKKLQQKIALYHPHEKISFNPNMMEEYDKKLTLLEELLSHRNKASTIVKNTLLIIIISLLTYPIIKQVNLPNKTGYILSLIILLSPLINYLIFQIIYSIKLRNKIKKILQVIFKKNKNIINNLFSTDNESITYVKDIYNLIMQKKYIDECTEKIIISNRKFSQSNYHHDKLKEHIETSNKLIDLLGIESIDIEPLEIDKINNLKENLSASKNQLYCPLNYILLINNIKNKIIINDTKNINLDNNLIGFIDSIIISYDKEYHNE